MSEEIIKTLEYIGSKFGMAIDWSAENVWPYVMDILGRYRTMSIINKTILLVVCLSIMVIAVVLVVKSVRGYIAHDKTWYYEYKFIGGSDPTGLCFATWIISGFALLFAFIGTCSLMHNLANWVFVPEIKFLEMLKSFV